MFKYVGICFRKYCDFSGRARLCEYWYLILFDFIFILVFTLIPELCILQYTGDEELAERIAYKIYGLYYLLTLLPHLACKVRRLHDLNKSAWNLFYYLIPIYG